MNRKTSADEIVVALGKDSFDSGVTILELLNMIVNEAMLEVLFKVNKTCL